jgi:hypothetical protein
MARKHMTALGAVALALLMVSALSFPVEARHGGGGGGGRGGHGWSGHGGGWSGHHGVQGHRSNGAPHAHRHFHHRGFRGRGFDGPYYDYGYYGGCSWLRRQALYTGSGYWWNRYYACLGDY